MGNLSGESREQIRKDKVTRFRSVTYARQLGLLVNTLGSHLKLTNTLTFSCPCPMARNLSLLPPNPDLSASFIRSLAGSEPGLRMKIIGEKGLDCSNIASKLITGGVTYFSLILPVTKFVMARYTLSTRKQRSSRRRWKSVRLSSYLPGKGADSGES